MRSIKVTSFLSGGWYIMWQTFPYSFGEVIAEAATPLVKRLVFMLLLLGSFRYLSKHAEPGMSYAQMGELLLPVFLSIFAVIVLPLLLVAFNSKTTKRRKSRTTLKVKQEYCRIMFGRKKIVRKWPQYYDGQKAILVYIFFIFMISPAFLYYNWHVFLVYFVVAVLFGTICTVKLVFSDEHRTGRILNRFINSDAYLNTLRYIAFCTYILLCAVVIVLEPKRIPLEFIFVIIIGMRVQLARGKSVISFFLWEANKGVIAIDAQAGAGVIAADAEVDKGALAADAEVNKGALAADAEVNKGALAADAEVNKGVLAADAEVNKGALAADAKADKGTIVADPDSRT